MRPRMLAALVSLVVLTTWLFSRPGGAVPAFARRHGYSCTVCHAPVPHLNEAGRLFAANAFEPPDRALPADYFSDVGDVDLSLLESIPLAIRADAFFDLTASNASDGAATDFKVPYGLKVFSGGRLSGSIGYYLSLRLADGGLGVGLEDASLLFTDLFGSGLNLRVGQFALSETLFQPELRMTFQDYLLYTTRPGLSQASLGLDRGVMLTYAFGFGLDLAGVVANGSGVGEAGVSGELDLDEYKSYLLRASQRIGPIRFGLMGYWGKEAQRRSLVAGEVTETDADRLNEAFIWGPDLSLILELAEIKVQYIQRRDLNPAFGPANEKQALLTQGFLVEAIAKVWGDPGKLYLVALFNYVDSEATDSQGQPIREEAYTANLTYMLRANIKLLGEYTFARFKQGAEVDEHRATIGVLGAW